MHVLIFGVPPTKTIINVSQNIIFFSSIFVSNSKKINYVYIIKHKAEFVTQNNKLKLKYHAKLKQDINILKKLYCIKMKKI